MRNNITWLQFSSGQGPIECEWLVGKLLDIFCSEAERKAIEYSIIAQTRRKTSPSAPDEDLGLRFRSVLVEIRGVDSEGLAREWCGTIQWIGQSPFRHHRRRNWFIAIDTVQCNPDVDLKNLEKQVTLTTFRAGGPGGQHVNKTSSAVRLLHRPTGVTVEVQDERSQHRNKQIAFKRLELLLSHKNDLAEENMNRNRRIKHYQLVRGNPRRVFIGRNFDAQ
jgi:peptide chain release factor